MSPTDPAGVRRSLFEPSYTLSGRVGANDLKAGIAVQIARSSNQALSQNRENPRLFLDWQRQSEAGEFGISAKYDQADTRINNIDNTGHGLANSTRASRSISGNWSNALTGRSTLSANGAYEAVSYKGGTFVDYSTASAGSMLRYSWSEQSASFIKMSYSEYQQTGIIPLSRTAYAILGMEWKPTSELDFTLQMGQSKISGHAITMQGAASMQYTGQRSHLALNADRHASPSGLGSFVTADQLNGNWSYDWSADTRTGIDLGWQKIYYATSINNRSTGAWLQHDLNSYWGTRTYYTRRDSVGSVTGSASSGTLGISLVYSNPNF